VVMPSRAAISAYVSRSSAFPVDGGRPPSSNTVCTRTPDPTAPETDWHRSGPRWSGCITPHSPRHARRTTP
jgi:hypothetical protein